MTLKEELTAAMDMLASNPRTRFIGYGVKYGRAMGTLKNVSDAQLVETPVAENLMAGLAIGMSLGGFYPVVFIERMDFILNASDAIVNHLDKIKQISAGEFRPAAILRVVVGNKNKPLYTGATHTQNFSDAFRRMLTMPVLEINEHYSATDAYDIAKRRLDARHSTMVIEKKDLL